MRRANKRKQCKEEETIDMKKNVLIDVTAVGWFGVHNDWPLGTITF